MFDSAVICSISKCMAKARYRLVKHSITLSIINAAAGGLLLIGSQI